jgi:hypothetical protein
MLKSAKAIEANGWRYACPFLRLQASVFVTLHGHDTPSEAHKFRNANSNGGLLFRR